MDYETLKFIWWILVGALLLGFAIMDGHDMGVGTLLPFVGKSDVERRIIINTVGPHWDGNQVWFITAGGAIFAAWPVVYSAAFSGFYWAMLAVLWALFFRPVGFDYRSKIESPTWRNTWDWGLFVGGAVSDLQDPQPAAEQEHDGDEYDAHAEKGAALDRPLDAGCHRFGENWPADDLD